MDLHFIEFGGSTFGMDTQSAVAFKALKKSVSMQEITPRGSAWKRKEPCVKASDVAAVMGSCAWLVLENKCMERIRWGDSGWHYIIYDQTAAGGN